MSEPGLIGRITWAGLAWVGGLHNKPLALLGREHSGPWVAWEDNITAPGLVRRIA
jgi:hypothetical protein